MPPRPSRTDIHSWFGLVNQVAPFLAIAPIMEPFRELLKKPNGKHIYWDSTLDAIFKTTKETIGRLAAEGLRYYDTSRPTMVPRNRVPRYAAVLSVCALGSPYVLQRRMEAGAEWKSAPNSSGEKLQHTGGGSTGDRLVPQRSPLIPPRLQKPNLRHGPQGLYQDFRRQGTSRYPQPTDV
ncbi:hypothetical protein Pmani_026360 [Petrolisthes manimaculis]|uniref:Uncharacterized protein n=1 Tax=Petrolisthes manimaculis TaxID=1843537 RepID=A0AAE1P6F9_9EUCA|nr:hypothetical protein Pmani_026360 [Petrolisthes manimaculis]